VGAWRKIDRFLELVSKPATGTRTFPRLAFLPDC
jgi:hypothetical protein